MRRSYEKQEDMEDSGWFPAFSHSQIAFSWKNWQRTFFAIFCPSILNHAFILVFPDPHPLFAERHRSFVLRIVILHNKYALSIFMKESLIFGIVFIRN